MVRQNFVAQGYLFLAGGLFAVSPTWLPNWYKTCIAF